MKVRFMRDHVAAERLVAKYCKTLKPNRSYTSQLASFCPFKNICDYADFNYTGAKSIPHLTWLFGIIQESA